MAQEIGDSSCANFNHKQQEQDSLFKKGTTNRSGKKQLDSSQDNGSSCYYKLNNGCTNHSDYQRREIIDNFRPFKINNRVQQDSLNIIMLRGKKMSKFDRLEQIMDETHQPQVSKSTVYNKK